MTKKVYKNRPRAGPQETTADHSDPARAASFHKRADGGERDFEGGD